MEIIHQILLKFTKGRESKLEKRQWMSPRVKLFTLHLLGNEEEDDNTCRYKIIIIAFL